MSEVLYDTSISLDRGFVFEFVKCLCIGAPPKDPAQKRFVVFWDFRKTREFPVKPQHREGQETVKCTAWVCAVLVGVLYFFGLGSKGSTVLTLELPEAPHKQGAAGGLMGGLRGHYRGRQSSTAFRPLLAGPPVSPAMCLGGTRRAQRLPRGPANETRGTPAILCDLDQPVSVLILVRDWQRVDPRQPPTHSAGMEIVLVWVTSVPLSGTQPAASPPAQSQEACLHVCV